MIGPPAVGVVYREDNLAALGRLPAACIDLVYLDPPFNTGRTFEGRGKGGDDYAFDDRWQGGLATYLDWMRPRLRELHRVLKPRGSLYLHCDDHAKHYLKWELDVIFGIRRFQNDIVWRRTSSHNNARTLGNVCDYLLYYTRSGRSTWNPQQHADGGPLTDYWPDIPPLNSRSSERVGYPTQKPVALLERIVRVSSNPGDVLLDPFAGSGTSLVAAERLGRRWVGIEQSAAACRVIAERIAAERAAGPQLPLPLEVAS